MQKRKSRVRNVVCHAVGYRAFRRTCRQRLSPSQSPRRPMFCCRGAHRGRHRDAMDRRSRKMNERVWKATMREMVDGVARCLCASAPAAARAELSRARKTIEEARTAERRRRWERQFDALVESAPYFRGAAGRYLGPRIQTAVTDAIATLNRLATAIKAIDDRTTDHGARADRQRTRRSLRR